MKETDTAQKKTKFKWATEVELLKIRINKTKYPYLSNFTSLALTVTKNGENPLKKHKLWRFLTIFDQKFNVNCDVNFEPAVSLSLFQKCNL